MLSDRKNQLALHQYFPRAGFTKYLYLVSNLLLAFGFQWILTRFLPGSLSVFPLAAVLIFWVWRLKFAAFLKLAIGTGFLADTFSILPFGTYSAAFVLLALAAEIVKSSLYDFETRLVQSMGTLFLIFVFFASLLPLAKLAEAISWG